jgi:predicted glycoside hydrolase/deacetylase ChbG (UPF0249 family)
VSLTLIINADDLGYDPAVTRGILESMRQGIVSSTTMIVNGPHSEDAARQVKGSQLAIGLHLNLARWAPLGSISAALLKADSLFDDLRAGELSAEEVERETLAQLDRLEALTGRAASHVDVHKHLHRHPQVLEGLAVAARARKLPVRSLDAQMRRRLLEHGVATNDVFIGDAGAQAHWTLDQLQADLGALPESGSVELMCHPGYVPSALKSGYSAQREVELKTFTSAQARQWLSSRKLQPTSWWALHAPG